MTGENIVVTEDAIRFNIKVVTEASITGIKTASGSKKLGAYADGKFIDIIILTRNNLSDRVRSVSSQG